MVTLTLGLSLAVILVLGFVLTSQITDRILEVKVRAPLPLVWLYGPSNVMTVTGRAVDEENL